MEWMQSVNAKLAKTSVSTVERTSVSKVERNKMPSRHFIRSEAFVNEKVIYLKRIKQLS